MTEKPKPTKSDLREQCEALGIVLSERVKIEDLEAALDAYARGWQKGAERAYHRGVADAGGIRGDDETPPQTFEEAVSRFGRPHARRHYTVLYDEMMRRERDAKRRRR